MFGEIGCLYSCARTCTIKSLDYSVLARLTMSRLRMITSDYPIFLEILQKQVFSYKDDFKNFMLNALARIDFLRGLNPHLFHLVIYKFKPRLLDQGEIFLKMHQPIDALSIVASGKLEILLRVDQIDLVVATLEQGDIFNQRNFFTKSQSKVRIRCVDRAKVLQLSLTELLQICETDDKFQKKIQMHSLHLVKNSQDFIIDWQPRSRQLQRKLILQNVAARILHQVQVKANQPSLRLILRQFKKLNYNKKLINKRILNMFRKRPEDIQDQQIERYLKFSRFMNKYEIQQLQMYSTLEKLKKAVNIFEASFLMRNIP